MKQGKTILELAQELERQSTAKVDLVVPTADMRMSDTAELVIPGLGNPEPSVSQPGSAVTPHAHGQIASRLNIPKKYYDRMLTESPHLLAENVNHWFTSANERRMVRMLDGNVRAFLSDRYQRIDNYEVADAALKAFQTIQEQTGTQLQFLSTEVTNTRLYINARFPRVEGEVKKDDPVQMGITISNSEIGSGRLIVQPLLYRLVCLNGMILSSDMDDYGLRKQHVGRKVEALEDYSIYSDETLQADDTAWALKIRDTVLNLAKPQVFDNLLSQLRNAAESAPIERPVRGVEVLSQKLGFTELEGESILTNLLRGDRGLQSDFSQWGLANAVTALANTAEDFDRSQEIMGLGSKVINLSPNEWTQIAEAA